MEDEKFNLFRLFLKHTIEGEKNYKDLVDSVVEQVHKLLKGVEDYYTIDRDNYTIIVYLSKRDPKFFETIKPKKLTTKDYNKILDIIEQQRLISTL